MLKLSLVWLKLICQITSQVPDVAGVVEVLLGVCAVLGELGGALADEGEALLLVHVPVKHVHLVVGEPVKDALDRLHREVAPPRVQEQSPGGRWFTRQSVICVRILI